MDDLLFDELLQLDRTLYELYPRLKRGGEWFIAAKTQALHQLLSRALGEAARERRAAPQVQLSLLARPAGRRHDTDATRSS